MDRGYVAPVASVTPVAHDRTIMPHLPQAFPCARRTHPLIIGQDTDRQPQKDTRDAISMTCLCIETVLCQTPGLSSRTRTC